MKDVVKEPLGNIGIPKARRVRQEILVYWKAKRRICALFFEGLFKLFKENTNQRAIQTDDRTSAID